MISREWHALTALDAVKALGADTPVGLSRDEAARRLAEHGPNTLPEAGRRPLWRVFAGQFASPPHSKPPRLRSRASRCRW